MFLIVRQNQWLYKFYKQKLESDKMKNEEVLSAGITGLVGDWYFAQNY